MSSAKRFPVLKHIEHDVTTDSVYVLMDHRTPRGESGVPLMLVRTREAFPGVNLDFGPDGELIGVEIL